MNTPNPGPWAVGKPYGASKVEIVGPSPSSPHLSVLVAASEPRNAPLIAAASDLHMVADAYVTLAMWIDENHAELHDELPALRDSHIFASSLLANIDAGKPAPSPILEVLAEAATEIANLDSRDNPVAQRIASIMKACRGGAA